MPSQTDLEQYQRHGYAVARSLFSPAEVRSLAEHYMALREAGAYPGDFSGVNPDASDPLRRYPRLIHMHRWDETSLRWLLDARLARWMTALLGREPLAVQTMLYFKPPGARGQALHQDQAYLRARPGTCMAAWLALDPCDEENGCLQVVPGSHTLPLLCTQRADTTVSFTDVTVHVPEGTEVAPILMQPGDVLFFHGSLIHGSYPNRSADRFRRALIGHYVTGESEQVSEFYHPVLRMDGTAAELGFSQGGGRCGVWKTGKGQSIVELITAP
ncbi:MAG: phytanoyl-CoA dioxygenase family protein [Armatimonadota bacterium]